MLKCHELLGFVSPALAQETVEYAYRSDKPLYRAVLGAVAEANRVRPAFLEKKPRVQRHTEMLAALCRPRMEEAAANLLRGWLLKVQTPMLADFLDTLGIPHEQGVVNDFPPTADDAKLKAAVDLLLGKYPAEAVIVYLNTVQTTGGVNWENLEQLLRNDPRLQLG
jgi:hypothetical protein